jgi:NADH dehydrogenase FAD-containing subunit
MQTIDDVQVSKKNKDISSISIDQPREKLFVLGSGWGSYAFLKTVDPTMYDITVISPRNYFTFTPMLAASAVGTVEFRSICEPIRNISPLIKFIEASATSIDPYKKSLSCQSIKCSGTVCEDFEFSVDYDKLLIAVGSVVNTFGIKGVRDNCQFLKQVEDAAKIRTSLSYCFERASIPNLSDEERKTALTFVIVGAGPTGVELIGELRDWMEIEGRRYFPQLLKYVEIVLVEAGNAVLAVFDNELQKEGLNRLTSTFSSYL